MEQQHHRIALQEYSSLRQELYEIIRARYTILTANIAFVGVIIGIVFTKRSELLDLLPWLPFVFLSVLTPSLLMNHYLTLHFYRLTSFLYVRFEKSNFDFIFERAWARFRAVKDKSYAAYTFPILFTYLLLVIFAFLVCVIANWQHILHIHRIFLIEIAVIFLFLLFQIDLTRKARGKEKQFIEWWKEVLDELRREDIQSSNYLPKRFVFIDRDGVINYNRDDHVKTLHEFLFLPRSIEAIVKLSNTGFGIVVISNQPVIEEGLAKVEDVEAIHRLLLNTVQSAGGKIERLLYCPHSETNNTCECRKPKPGMLLQAKSDLGIDLDHSFLVGDQITDIQAGKAVNCCSILVRSGLGKRWIQRQNQWPAQPDAIVSDLLEAAELIIRSVQ